LNTALLQLVCVLVAGMLILLLAMTVFPQTVLWLPQTMGYATH